MNKVDNTNKMKVIGMIFMAISLLALIGLIGSIEPNCYYTTDLFAQYRYCGKEYVGEEKSVDFFLPVVFISIFFVGLFFVGSEKNKSLEDEE